MQVQMSEGRDTSFTAQMWDEATMTKQQAVDNFNDGIRAIQAGDADSALPLFQKAVELDPTLSAAHRTIAAILHGMGKPAEALEPLNKYLEFEELPPEFVGMAFDIFLAAGDPRVEEAKQRAIEAGMGTEIAAGIFSQGVQAVRDSDDERAVELFTEAASLNPKLYQALPQHRHDPLQQPELGTGPRGTREDAGTRSEEHRGDENEVLQLCPARATGGFNRGR